MPGPTVITYGDIDAYLLPLRVTYGALFVVGLVGAAVLMRWVQGREEWAGEPPRPRAALVTLVLCWAALPYGFTQLYAPIEFHALELVGNTATFRRAWPETDRSVPLDEIERIEILRNGRLAFWFVDPEGAWTEDDLEVTRVIYYGDQPKRLREAAVALEARGWTGQVGGPDK